MTLILDNSALPCLPLSAAKGAGVSRQRGRCGACAVDVPCGLERHESRLLCPLCHLTQHLAEAGRLEAGKVIWLPKIAQADLNRFCATFFLLMAAPKSHEEAVAPMRARMKAIYQGAFETKAALDYENFLSPDLTVGGALKKTPVTLPLALTSPVLLAHALDEARNRDRFDHAKLDGLRLLFFPAPLRALIKAWRDDFYRARPPERWTGVSAPGAVDG